MSAAPPFPDALRAGDAGLAPIPDVEESWAREVLGGQRVER